MRIAASTLCNVTALLFLVTGTSAMANPVYTAICSMDNDHGSYVTSTGTSSCSVSIPTASGAPIYGVSTASAHADLLVARDPSQWSYLSFTQDVEMRGYASSSPYVTSPRIGSAYSTIQYSANMTTAGPLRPGYLLLDPNLTGLSYYFASTTITMGIPQSLPFTTSPNLLLTCMYGGAGFCNYSNLSPLSPLRQPIAVVLGSPFQLSLNSTAAALGDAGSGYAHTYIDTTASYGFRFVEADGVTPVLASETPEPATWGFVIAAVAGLMIMRRKRTST